MLNITYWSDVEHNDIGISAREETYLHESSNEYQIAQSVQHDHDNMQCHSTDSFGWDKNVDIVEWKAHHILGQILDVDFSKVAVSLVIKKKFINLPNGSRVLHIAQVA